MQGKVAPHLAYWFTYSFYGVQNNSTGNSKVIFMGAHKNRNLERVGEEPSVEDLKPKANFSVIDGNSRESIPFPAEELPRVLMALCRVSNVPDLLEDSELRAHMIAEDESPSNIIYFERNFHDMQLTDVFNAARRKNQMYNYYYPEPLTRLNDFQWLQNGKINFNRPIIRDKKEVGHITQLIAVGKDVKWNHPVIGFRKSWDNYVSIIPIVDTVRTSDGRNEERFGISLATTIQFLTYHKPPVRFITPEYYQNKVVACRKLFEEAPLIRVNFADTPINDLIYMLERGA